MGGKNPPKVLRGVFVSYSSSSLQLEVERISRGREVDASGWVLPDVISGEGTSPGVNDSSGVFVLVEQIFDSVRWSVELYTALV
jgi:hypothetical protein